MKIKAFVLTALLSGGAVAQSSPARQLAQDNPYTALIRTAKQVILYVPRLNDGQLINALKVANNLSVPLRVVSNDDGLMQQNGHILSLIILGIPVFQTAGGGDRRQFMEIQTQTGWAAYDISEGRPVRKSMLDYSDFNTWFSKNSTRLPRYIPEGATAMWVKAYLGKDLQFTNIVFKDDAVPQMPVLNNPPTK